jgi:hypothetical protein
MRRAARPITVPVGRLAIAAPLKTGTTVDETDVVLLTINEQDVIGTGWDVVVLPISEKDAKVAG